MENKLNIMKIAISIHVGTFSIWSNGVNQNAIYLAMLLKKAGHDAYLLYSRDSKTNKTKESLEKLKLDVGIINLKNAYEYKFDVVIQLGLAIEVKDAEKFRENNKNIKFVSYECGNHFFIDTEKIIYDKHSNSITPNYVKPDQIWSIPQMENTNLHYYAFKKKCNNVTVVPFIWDPIAIEDDIKKMNYQTYTPRDIKKIAVMEPNISIMKNCIFPIVILEKFINEKDCELDHVYLVGAIALKNKKSFKNLIKNTTLFNEKKLSAEDRIKTTKMINVHADAILSWQWENNLNYLYLDVAWLGWPIIHNANLCKDVGYYYDSFDAQDAVDNLKYVVDKHNKNVDYMKNMRNIIKRYTKDNEDMIKGYNSLLEDLVDNKFIKRKYNWKTNTINF